jgi:hypothetical protein
MDLDELLATMPFSVLSEVVPGVGERMIAVMQR